MNALRAALLGTASIITLACGSSVPASIPPAPSAAASAIAAPSSAPLGSASAAATAKPVSSGAAAAEKPEAPPEPPFGGEDPGVKAKLSGKEAWGYWPAYGVGLLDLRSVEGSHVLFSEFAGKATLSIPGAFTHETESAKLKKGDLVLATIVTSGKCARIEEVTGESAKVSFIWGDKLDSRDFEMNKLLRLDGKLGFGAPTLRKNDVGEWFAGTLVYADAKTAWIAGEFMSPEAKAPVADVHPVDITKQRKKGDKVLACAFAMGGCAEVTIAGPLYGGLAYEVSLPKDMDNHEDPKAKTAIVDACHMMSAPKK